MGLVVELCGLPGSGKSTLAAHICAALRTLRRRGGRGRPARVGGRAGVRTGPPEGRWPRLPPRSASRWRRRRVVRAVASSRATPRDGLGLRPSGSPSSGLQRSARARPGVSLLEEGVVQTVWSLALRAPADGAESARTAGRVVARPPRRRGRPAGRAAEPARRADPPGTAAPNDLPPTVAAPSSSEAGFCWTGSSTPCRAAASPSPTTGRSRSSSSGGTSRSGCSGSLGRGSCPRPTRSTLVRWAWPRSEMPLDVQQRIRVPFERSRAAVCHEGRRARDHGSSCITASPSSSSRLAGAVARGQRRGLAQ